MPFIKAVRVSGLKNNRITCSECVGARVSVQYLPSQTGAERKHLLVVPMEGAGEHRPLFPTLHTQPLHFCLVDARFLSLQFTEKKAEREAQRGCDLPPRHTAVQSHHRELASSTAKIREGARRTDTSCPLSKQLLSQAISPAGGHSCDL